MVLTTFNLCSIYLWSDVCHLVLNKYKLIILSRKNSLYILSYLTKELSYLQSIDCKEIVVF